MTFKQNRTKKIPHVIVFTEFQNISGNADGRSAWNWFIFFVSCTFIRKFRPVSLAAAVLHHVAFKCRSQFISFLLLRFLSVMIRVMGRNRSLTKHLAFAWPWLQFLLQTHIFFNEAEVLKRNSVYQKCCTPVCRLRWWPLANWIWLILSTISSSK